MNVASVNVEVFTSSKKPGNQKNYIYNQELNKNNQIDSEDELRTRLMFKKLILVSMELIL